MEFHPKIREWRLVASLVVLDQLVKWLVRKYLVTEMVLLPNIRFVHLQNDGIAFSLPMPQLFLIVLTIVFLGWFGQQLWQQHYHGYQKIGGFLLLGGAVGNFIDRVLFGSVTDFIAVGSFPVFNLADSFITIGIALFFWAEFRNKA